MTEAIIKLLVASLIVVSSYMLGKLIRQAVKLFLEQKILTMEIELISIILAIYPDEREYRFSGYTTNKKTLEKIEELLKSDKRIENWSELVQLQSQLYLNQSGEVEHPVPNGLKYLESTNAKLLKYKKLYKKLFRVNFNTQS